ncbi:MAG TPA: metallophosphoesterase [Vicinamibacteria bacterium]|nr:metallophosphoesterase [Vicinamibacteria bacterium]
MKRRAALLAVAAALVLGGAKAPEKRPEPTTFTFFVGSDSHFGYAGMLEANRSIVEQMNALPGTPYPPEIGGVVDTPRGLVFTGDTTENGTLAEFAEFEQVFGLTGKDGLLRFPVFEAIGNHDVNRESPIKEVVTRRHGGIQYAWDWFDVRMICLDMYPDDATRAWLEDELARVGPDRPVIVYFHYSLQGPYSDSWTQDEKRAFGASLAGFNVLAIFHGHWHRYGHYLWNGMPVFRPGSPKHSSRAFLVVRVRPREMDVAAWDFEKRGWIESWTVPVRR